ncbi:tetratricopeptide repeat protein [Porphyromonas pogonae]|uniref:tetratricopeptide repeat protein n=1 Tax=Porphyromonas pogonae TaxID=867595 RepID=UPI002E76B2F4|nr:tetratricopeptide repeat protein [Porphyromonas pogonae]
MKSSPKQISTEPISFSTANIIEFEPDPANEEMALVLELIRNTNQSFFLTGKAGTGKSTLLRYIKANTHKEHVVLASTGIAALNVGGQTIHSFFKLPFRPITPDDPDLSRKKNRVYEVFKYPKQHRELIRKLELIIIDEISMVRADVIDAMDSLLRTFTGHIALPFGGIQMIFVGDLFQLEPVVKSDEAEILQRFYPDNYFFSARVFGRNSLVTIELLKVYRQDDPVFVDILDHIREGNASPQHLNMINKSVLPDYKVDRDEFIITLGTRRNQVSSINEMHMNELPDKPIRIAGHIDGEFPDNNLPTDLTLTLKQNAQVMFLANDRDKRWANGTLGIIEEICGEEHYVSVRTESGAVYRVDPYIWENKRYTYSEKEHKIKEEVIGQFMQIPLKPAWAITVHKSQGLTFDKVVVDFSDGVFAGGQAYVALSRCRSLGGLILKKPLGIRDIIVRSPIIKFYKKANNREIIRGSIDKADAQRGYVQAAMYWKKGEYIKSVERLRFAMEKSNEFDNPVFRRMLSYKLMDAEKQKVKIAQLSCKLEKQQELINELAKEYTAMGNDCMQLNEPDAAIRNYNKALRINPNNIDAAVQKGKAYAVLNEIKESLKTLNEAVKLSPLHPEALFVLGETLVKFGYYDDAEQYLLKAMAQNPKSIKVHRTLVTMYDFLGDEERAEQHRDVIKKLTASKTKRKS